MEILPDVREVPDADAEEISRLRLAIEQGRATMEDKVMWHKHLFKSRVVQAQRYTDILERDEELLVRMFHIYLKDTMGILQRVQNAETDRTGAGPEGISIFQDNVLQRADAIRGISERLGVNNMHVIGARVSRDALETYARIFLLAKPRLVTAFGLREQGTGARTQIVAAQELINQCLHAWGFTELVRDGRRRRLQVDIGGYRIAVQKRYEGFIA